MCGAAFSGQLHVVQESAGAASSILIVSGQGVQEMPKPQHEGRRQDETM
jgi:hypothetical protein